MTTADLARALFAGRLTIPRREAAAALGVGRDYLDALIAEGLIGHVRHGRCAIRFRIEDICGYLAAPRVPRAYEAKGAPCPSTSPGAGRATSTTSDAEIVDFEDLREKRRAARPKRSSGG